MAYLIISRLFNSKLRCPSFDPNWEGGVLSLIKTHSRVCAGSGGLKTFKQTKFMRHAKFNFDS